MKISTLPLYLLLICSTGALAQNVPAQLPDPDGLRGDAKKPLKIYLLAGQSNMVGMGQLSGAKNLYDAVYYSSDPAAPLGPMAVYKVGQYLVSPLTVMDATGKESREAITEGQIKVPESGVYRVHSTAGTLHVNGKALPPDRDLSLNADTRYPFKIVGAGETPPRLWMQKMDLLGYGDLEAVVKRQGKFPWLVDDSGEWTVRQDVTFREARLTAGGKHSPLSPTSNGKTLGPELGFGHVLGTFHDEQVLIIKTAQGNRALGFDFRPPSSGRTDPDNAFEAAEYRLMVEGVRETLAKLEDIVPGYAGQGYEMAGFAWFQGHKDSYTEQLIVDYEKNLVNLIQDVRKEFNAPKMPVVVATIGFQGYAMAEKFQRIHAAQMAVGNPETHPAFAGTVRSVDTRDFWRDVSESPKNEDYHYNRNAETYTLIGDAIGRAMVTLQGGTAEPLPVSKRSSPAAPNADIEQSEAERLAGQTALRPILVNGIAADYINDPRTKATLLAEAAGDRPERANQFLRGAMYGLVNCYNAAGIETYNWQPFGPNLDAVEWTYISFAPAEVLAKEKGNRFRKVTLPSGMTDWFAPNFDARAAGWKTGRQPFGQLDGKLAPLSESCTASFCRCGEAPNTLWQKEVLLARGTFEFPPLKEGHRYRIVLGGSAHVNSGEGFAIYANGKLLGESDRGVAVRQGGQPRGAHVYQDVREAFTGKQVTLAVTSFLRYNHPRQGLIPPRGHLSLQVEEQRLPPIK